MQFPFTRGLNNRGIPFLCATATKKRDKSTQRFFSFLHGKSHLLSGNCIMFDLGGNLAERKFSCDSNVASEYILYCPEMVFSLQPIIVWKEKRIRLTRLPCEACCVKETPMQVDSSLMNVGDGGTVSREISAPNKVSTSMVGNPPQTLPLEFRGDVTLGQQNKTAPTTDCKTARACPDTSNYNLGPELPPPRQLDNEPMSSSAPAGAEKTTDKRAVEAAKIKDDGTGAFPAPQRSSGIKASREDSANPCRSKKSQTQTPSAPPGFQCSLFKPAQPVAFLPSTDFSSPLCKVTLPPALGQIAALREATASQFPKDIQAQTSGVAGTPLMRTYHYPFSMARIPASDKKSSKLKVNHSSSKNAKSVGEHKSLASAAASPGTALPPQHPSLNSAAPTRYTLSPTAAICCGSALATIASQSRLLNQVEKSLSLDKIATGALKTEEHRVACSLEPRDVPLDLSAKSKRPKCTNDPAVSTKEPQSSESNKMDLVNSKRTYSATGQYPVLPTTHRNGSHPKQSIRPQNHHVSEPKPVWSKGASQEPIKNIPGTYVGVASPILASTLRGKDGKGTFVEEFQSFAKQEFISIIDQGEQVTSGGKKPPSLKHAHNVKHVKNTSTAITKKCPAKGALMTALSSATTAHLKSGKAAGPYSAWQQSPHAPHQASSAQRKISPGSQTAKGTVESSKFQSPSIPAEDSKVNPSALSNLASIVKQQDLETSAPASDALAVVSRKDSVMTLLKDTPSKQASLNEPPASWSTENWPGVLSRGGLTPSRKRPERSKPTETSENNAEIHSHRVEHKHGFSKPFGQSHSLRSNASTNGNRLDSKLAQVLEGEVLKIDSKESDAPPDENLGGIVASILSRRSPGRGDEKKTNGTKEESPTKAVKQKKVSPKKPTKERSPVESAKKTTGEKEKDVTPIKVSSQKKKKQKTSELEQRLSCQSQEQTWKDEEPHDKTDGGSSPEGEETRALKSGAAAKEAAVKEASFPRLRRGRRRADEARLDLWGFATPSPPPPPPPPPPPLPMAPSPSLPRTPARRPRGRPRSSKRDVRNKVKAGDAEDDAPAHKRRQHCRNRKYQMGEYVTETDKLEEGEHLDESDSGITADAQTAQCPSPAASSPEPAPVRRPSFTRSGSVRYQAGDVSLESNDKPSGKRKFKSKHLCDSDEQKTKTKRSSLGKRGAAAALDEDATTENSGPPPPAKSLPSSLSGKMSSSGKNGSPESPPKRPIPPEVRRLIVNKNAGETLLQRAARLGYQEVVQYCLEKDIREVNRRDNAGYTALHEASSRGWTQIVQMLLKHGADVNCSAQDGTRPLHDAVASDNLPIVWLLLNHGADPTLATYSGHTPVKLAHSDTMKSFLTEYFIDLEGRGEQDPTLHWDFYSSSLFETGEEPCWDYLLSQQNQESAGGECGNADRECDKDTLVFEFSSEPLLPCYHLQVSVTQGFCNWFLLSDVLKRLKTSARVFRARHPHLEVAGLSRIELGRQVLISQVGSPLDSASKDKVEDDEAEEEGEEDEEEGLVHLVRCVPELQRLLGSSVHILEDDDDEEEDEEEEKPRGR
ncbi:BCL-6 corepressor-like protein 1 isoform X2 [Phycodurus eques]|uniref:BCL-6 corepressor-like protein 1 isoform X2 n=1 Tax=Phycodurus eques TaxID=693459 RepID=UPI002ACEBB0A|nr:BCL-6 corepressor-like protein 1 isoform X2 [Phycodurus eques]